ncbi:MAG: carbohydrate porin [Burkholderiales bacterium]|nr:carbohydrate porin [Burkholderiales bacterium]
MLRGLVTLLLAMPVALPLPGVAQHKEEQTFDARFQSTYVWQNKPGFRAPYSGANSLSPDPETSYTWTVTAFIGWRPWANGELYFNPEGIQGRALSNVVGLGGLSNGELQKSAGPDMRFYRARLFYRHTVNLGGPQETLDSEQNQLAGTVDTRRFVLTLGNLSISDVFGTSEITGDVRTQFLNWASLDHGHFDYAADARSFSWGIFGELVWDHWSLRAGRFLQPRNSNGLRLDYRILRRYGDQIEFERRHTFMGQPGQWSAFVFRNVATMAAFRDAINAAPAGTAPSFDNQRRPQSKVGFGVAFEQSITDDLRVLARGGAHDGRTESYAFTEIDRSFYTAASIKGNRWGRAHDHVGVALAMNGLSSEHRRYLARGGLGFFLGDGRLDYRGERIFETYYSWAASKQVAVSLNWQHITNPGYNRDRGPVGIASLRLHFEY